MIFGEPGKNIAQVSGGAPRRRRRRRHVTTVFAYRCEGCDLAIFADEQPAGERRECPACGGVGRWQAVAIDFRTRQFIVQVDE